MKSNKKEAIGTISEKTLELIRETLNKYEPGSPLLQNALRLRLLAIYFQGKRDAFQDFYAITTRQNDK